MIGDDHAAGRLPARQRLPQLVLEVRGAEYVPIMLETKRDGRWVWAAPLAWSDRRRLWQRGGRRVAVRWASFDDITLELAARGIEVQSYCIDAAAFWRYVDESGYRETDYFGGANSRLAIEKWLEHFVSIDLLRPLPGDVVVDIASCASPFPDILRQRWSCRTYRQDWLYAPGIEGDRIGGDAAALPIPSGFADALTLHCSFEHFEGDRDFLFLREAERVLRPGGRLCILPLYTNRAYSIQTDLEAWNRRRPSLERDALICVAPAWGEVHGRFYDAAHFTERILRNLGALRLQLFRVENYREVAADCYLKLAALFTKA
jgi:SAM-dependent methyltransferase